ncbi:MAG: hypothetical protein J7M03_07985, partial [Candidatus Desulfofervidaceae bacterium]|nr:hypothetical protein [Candidatus Desulfofervidaceae bacterium]
SGEGENKLYVLDARKGEVIWSYQVSALPAYGFEQVSLGTGVAISPDGRYVGCLSCDGRLFVFDNRASVEVKRPVLLWQKQVVEPIWVSGIPIYAYAGKLLINNQGEVLVVIGSTYIAPGFGKGHLPEIAHPLENSLYLLTSGGKLKWVWQSQGGIQTQPVWDETGRFLAIALQHNYITRQKKTAGLYVFDLYRPEAEKLVWFYPLEGIGINTAISPDGHFVGVIEGPIDINPDPEREDCVGKHRVHLLS